MTEGRTFVIEKHLRWNDAFVPIGTVALDAAGMLSVAEAAEGFEDVLADLAEEVNALEAISIRVPPPEGVEPFTLLSRTHARDDPGVAEAVAGYLEQNYGMRLCATEDAGPPP